MLQASHISAFQAVSPDARQQRVSDLQRQLLEISIAHQQLKATILQKQLQSVHHYIHQLWHSNEVKPIHRISSADTLTSEDCRSEESRTGQEAGYPSKVTCSPWTQSETQQTCLVFRIETCLRRGLFEAVPCTEVERKAKVHRFLLKSKENKAKRAISRVFEGRRATAKAKVRVNGRFVKSEETSIA